MNKLQQIIRLCIYLVLTVFCFLDMFEFKQWTSEYPHAWPQGTSIIDQQRTSLGYSPAFHSAAKFFLTLFMLLILANIVLLIVELVRQRKLLKNPLLSLLNISPLVVLFIATLILTASHSVVTSSGYLFFSYEVNALYIVFIVLYVLNLVFLYVKLPEAQKKEGTAPQILQGSSTADELKKYKELLDSGVLTQEEFDAKKKQLLG